MKLKFWKLKKNKEEKIAELILYGEISSSTWYGDEVTPQQFNKDLENLGDVETINVRINSYGGDVFAGSAIYSMLKRHSANIVVYIDGIAASAASLIAMAGDKIIMPSNAMMMIHNPWTIAIGDSEEMRKTADVLDKIRDAVVNAYQEKSSLSKDEIIAIMKADTWLTAEDAVNYGFADELEDREVSMKLEPDNIIINGVKMSVDLSSLLKVKQTSDKNIKGKGIKTVHERETNMNLEALCSSVGLNYKLLKDSGLTDDQIKLTVVEIQMKQQGADPGKPQQPDQQPPQAKIEPKEEPKQKTEDIKDFSAEAVLEVLNICKSFDMDATEFIKNKSSVAEVRDAALKIAMKKNEPISSNPPEIKVTQDEEDKFRAAASDSILMRGSKYKIEKPADGAREIMAMSIKELAIYCLEKAGVKNPRMLNINELMRMSLTPDSAFTSILDNTVNKSMAQAYQYYQPSHKLWTGTGSVSDFKPMKVYQISEAGDMKKINQKGEFTFDQMSDVGVQVSIDTKGKMFGFTREAMINDDIGVLTRVPQAYILSYMCAINEAVYDILNDNSVIYDGKRLFHTDHANLASVGATITNGIDAGYTAMQTQKGIRNKRNINAVPKFAIVPPAQRKETKQLVRSTSDPLATNPGVINPFQGEVEPVVEPYLSDAAAWFLAADPMLTDTIWVSYLNGQEMPFLDSQVGFDFLGMRWRIYGDSGVTVIDWRGMYKNPGPSQG